MENKIKAIAKRHTTNQCVEIIKTSLRYFSNGVKEYINKVLLDIHACQVASERRHTDNYAAVSFNYYLANLRRAKESITEFYNTEANVDRKLILGFAHEAVEGVLRQYDRDI